MKSLDIIIERSVKENKLKLRKIIFAIMLIGTILYIVGFLI